MAARGATATTVLKENFPDNPAPVFLKLSPFPNSRASCSCNGGCPLCSATHSKRGCLYPRPSYSHSEFGFGWKHMHGNHARRTRKEQRRHHASSDNTQPLGFFVAFEYVNSAMDRRLVHTYCGACAVDADTVHMWGPGKHCIAMHAIAQFKKRTPLGLHAGPAGSMPCLQQKMLQADGCSHFNS